MNHKTENEALRNLSTSDVASLLNCSEATVRSLQDAKKLPVFYVGARRRVREADLLEWMKAGGERDL